MQKKRKSTADPQAPARPGRGAGRRTKSGIAAEPSRRATQALLLPLSRDATLRVATQAERAMIRVESDGHAPLEISIEMSAAGPVLRARAAAVELQAERVGVDCKGFALHAKNLIDIRSGGDMLSQAGGRHDLSAKKVSVEATVGSVSLKANDDVQLLGEQVLLNCERPAPMPPWLPKVERQASEPSPVPLSAASGDASLLGDLVEDERKRP